MQKQTFKLQALVFAFLALAMPQSGASFSYMARIGGGLKFATEKVKFSGIKFPTYQNGALKEWTDAGDVETEAVDYQVTNLSAAISAIYKFSDFCGVGPIVEVGYSFAKDRCKSWKSLTLKEGAFAKVGVGVSITDWVMISAGVRFSQLTADLSFSDEEKGLSKALKAAEAAYKIFADADKAEQGYLNALRTSPPDAKKVSNYNLKTVIAAAAADAARAAAGSYSPSIDDYDFDISKSYSDTQNVWGGYLDFSVLLPITDAVKLVFTLGISKDFTSPEFGLGKVQKCTALPVAANTQSLITAAADRAKEASDAAQEASDAAQKADVADAAAAQSDAAEGAADRAAAEKANAAQTSAADRAARDAAAAADAAVAHGLPASWDEVDLKAKVGDRGFIFTIGLFLAYCF